MCLFFTNILKHDCLSRYICFHTLGSSEGFLHSKLRYCGSLVWNRRQHQNIYRQDQLRRAGPGLVITLLHISMACLYSSPELWPSSCASYSFCLSSGHFTVYGSEEEFNVYYIMVCCAVPWAFWRKAQYKSHK